MMKLILHILWKDIRHHWREVLVSLALLIAYGWKEVRGWRAPEELMAATGLGGLFGYRFLFGMVLVLLPVSWALLIVRVVQGESLVGDRQFWVTRPYDWKKLLAAKGLFALLFINVPLFVLDLFLLAKAGFPPRNYVIGLLWMQVMMTLTLVVPAATLAAVTASIAQMLLLLLLTVLYGIGMGFLSEHIPSSGFSSFSDFLVPLLLMGTAFVVLLLQYSRRKTSTSRWLLAGLAGVLVLLEVVTPYRTLVARDYPHLESTEAPFQLSLLPGETSTAEPAGKDEQEAQIRLPLSVAGVTPESIVDVDGYLVEIAAEDGLHWDSGWKHLSLNLFPDVNDTQIHFALNRSLFERLKTSPVQLRLSLAYTLFRDRNRRDFVIPSGEFIMAEAGRCSAGQGYSRNVWCLAPLRGPSSLLITTDMSASTCPLLEGESAAKPGQLARGWIHNEGLPPAQFGISPIWPINLSVWPQGSFSNLRPAGGSYGTGLCQGTPVILSHPEPVRRNQLTVQFDSVRLADYRQQPLRFLSPPVIRKR